MEDDNNNSSDGSSGGSGSGSDNEQPDNQVQNTIKAGNGTESGEAKQGSTSIPRELSTSTDQE